MKGTANDSHNNKPESGALTITPRTMRRPKVHTHALSHAQAKVPDVDNIIRCFPPNAPPAVASEETSGFLEDGSFEDNTLTSLLPSPPSPPAAAAAGAAAAALGASGAAIRGSGGSRASSSLRGSQRRRAAGSSVGAGAGGGGGAYGRSSNSSSNNSSNGHSFNRDSLDVSSISGIARLDDDHVSISNSNGSGSGNDNSISNASLLASDDVLLRARAIRGVGGLGSLGSLGRDDDRNGRERPADANSRSRTGRTLGRSNSSSAADTRKFGDGGGSRRSADSRWSSGRGSRIDTYRSSLDPGRSNDTTTTTSSTATNKHTKRIADASGASPSDRRRRPQPSDRRPASSAYRTAAMAADSSPGGPADVNSQLYPTITISPESPLSRGGRRRTVHRAAPSATERSSRSRLSRSSGSGDAAAAALNVEQTPPGRRSLRGARDAVNFSGRSGDELESAVFGNSGVGDGLRGSGERSEGLGGVEDSPGIVRFRSCVLYVYRPFYFFIFCFVFVLCTWTVMFQFLRLFHGFCFLHLFHFLFSVILVFIIAVQVVLTLILVLILILLLR